MVPEERCSIPISLHALQILQTTIYDGTKSAVYSLVIHKLQGNGKCVSSIFTSNSQITNKQWQMRYRFIVHQSPLYLNTHRI